jgi:peptidoglycan hydrolase-like protein with peptidoglycan-binding domain
MNRIMRALSSAAATAVLVIALAAGSQYAGAQPFPTPSQSTVKALQEALTKQGFPVTADGALNEATRDAIRKYQLQHHLKVTGEPDQPTLNKLGVVEQNNTSTEPALEKLKKEQRQAKNQAMHDQSMNCSSMQGQMQTMLDRMQTMHDQMQQMTRMLREMRNDRPK